MSDQVLDIVPAPTPHQIAARDRSERRKVTGRLKRALDLMIWEGKRDNEAAVSAGMNVLSIRSALEKPHVLAYYKAQREVLRARECARNIHRLTEIRDKADNMPAVQAIKMLEQLGDGESVATSRGSVSSPGLTIQIVQVSGSAAIAAVPQDVTPKVLK